MKLALLLSLLAGGGAAPPPVDAIRGQLAEARARAAVAGERVFKSRLVVWFRGDVSGEVQAKELTVTVDGDAVFVGEPPLRGSETSRVFDMWVPAGRHSVGASLLMEDWREKGARPRGMELTVAGSWEIATQKERVTVVLVRLTADGSIPAGESEEAGEAKGDFDARVRAKWKMRPLAEAEESP